jgi:hypothetical protein
MPQQHVEAVRNVVAVLVVAPEMLCQQADRDPAESAGRPSRTGPMPHMLPAVSKESFPHAVNPGA